MTEERKTKSCTLALCVYSNLDDTEICLIPRWFIRSILRYFDPEYIVTRDPEPITARKCCWSGLYWHSDMDRVNQYWNGGEGKTIKEHFPLLPEDGPEWDEFRNRMELDRKLRDIGENVATKILKKAVDDEYLNGVLQLLVYFGGASTKEELKKEITRKNRELVEELLSFPRE